MTYEIVGTTDALYLQAPQGLDRPYHGLRTDAGYHQACFGVDNITSLTEVRLEWDGMNPNDGSTRSVCRAGTPSCWTGPA